MQTTKQIEELITARQAEGRALVAEHEADAKAFMERRAARQQKITHIEGMLLAYRALLPKQKREATATKKKK